MRTLAHSACRRGSKVPVLQAANSGQAEVWKTKTILRMSALLALTAAMAVAGQQAFALARQGNATVAHKRATVSQPAPGVSAQVASSWQTNGTVWAIAYVGGRVFIGGQFTEVRPPGAAPGKRQQARAFLAEFNSHNGDLIQAFDPTLTGPSGGGVYALAASADGKTLYVGGLFNGADGHARDNLAAFDVSTGHLTAWAPEASGPANTKVNTIAPSPTGSTIYLGGSFDELGTPGTMAGVQARTFAGAVDASGNVLPWAPVLNNAVTSIALATAGSAVQQVLIGGYFQTIDGVSQNAAGAVDPSIGRQSEPWSANIVPYDPPACTSAVKDIVISGGVAYLAAEGTGSGCFDGDFAVTLSLSHGDHLRWQNDCLGATQALVVIDGYLFKGSHAHDCAYAPGGFPQRGLAGTKTLVTYHLLDQSLSNGTLGHFTPSTNATLLGPRALATDGRQLFVGGDFTVVDGKRQQGFAIFGSGEDQVRPPRPGRPYVTSNWKGRATITLDAVSTPDIGRLQYTIYERGRKTPLGHIIATSWPWALPLVHYQASGLRPGARLTFSVTVSDGLSTSLRSPSSGFVRIARRDPRESYRAAVLAAKPSFFWPLSERSGTKASDATAHHFNGIYERGVGHGAAGPIAGKNAIAASFNGTTGIATAVKQARSPSSFSIEVWFKTNTETGGEIVGFGNQQTGSSTQYDRQIYMMNDGQLVFGVRSISGIEAIETPNVYNDGRWHYVVATFDSTAASRNMALYVDGAQEQSKTVRVLQSYLGYWRVGGGNLSGWNFDPWVSNSQGTTQPNSYYFRGDAGDLAVYPRALSAKQVGQHYALAGP
jgi:hypothetical protein